MEDEENLIFSDVYQQGRSLHKEILLSKTTGRMEGAAFGTEDVQEFEKRFEDLGAAGFEMVSDKLANNRAQLRGVDEEFLEFLDRQSVLADDEEDEG